MSFTAAILFAGWRRARWWRRGVSVAALPYSLLSAALALNLWVGYFPTVQTAWNQLTAGPLPDQTDQVTVTAMQQQRKIPPKGTVVPVDISDRASGFRHRGQFCYLPPAWQTDRPTAATADRLMIGGEFNTPADWLRTRRESSRLTISPPLITGTPPSLCSSIRAVCSTTTPSVSTAAVATPPTT